jgi:hypothetical protein
MLTVMSEASSVLILGHSSMTFAEFPDGQSLLDRTAAELARLRPDVAWRCESELLYISSGMAGYVLRRIDGKIPDIAVMRVAEMHFLHDYVVYRIRRRWPAMYRTAIRVSETLVNLAGGGPSGTPSMRGWIFRVPRWIGAKLIGVAPEVEVDDAVAYTTQTLGVLLRKESTHVVLVSSSNSMTPNIPASEAERRRSYYMGEIRRYCREHTVLVLDPGAVAAGLDTRIRLGPDRWHEDIEGRDLQARMYAQAIVQALEGRREFELALS